MARADACTHLSLLRSSVHPLLMDDACTVSKITRFMLASYPYITNQEFDEACQLLVQRFHGKLDSTDWIAVNHVPGVLHIRKSYATPNKRDDDVRSGTVLGEKSEDDVIELEDPEVREV